MGRREFHYCWEYDLEASPEALWPLVADTNRFNRDAGVPRVERLAEAESLAGGQTGRGRRARRLQLSVAGVRVAWEEEPFEWIRPLSFGVIRRYLTGPLAEMRVRVELKRRADAGTHLVYQVWAQPRNALGQIAIPLQIGLLSARKFAEVIRRYDRMARLKEAAGGQVAVSSLKAGERARLASLGRRLIEEGAPRALVARLCETIEESDDLTLSRLRPFALADYWNEPRRQTLELCLRATRAGLLDLSWDLLCPLCRGASERAPSLRDVRADAHCDSCHVSFNVNFDRSVEVTFRPNPSVRQIEARQFCVGSPQLTPHIAAQLFVAPGQSRTLAPALEEGRYRLRTNKLAGGQFLSVAAGGEREVTLRADASGWPTDERCLAPQAELRFENATDEEQLFILERTAWTDTAATAADVTALQLFRDLFASEALRPDEQISVGSLTILFTDLRDSTRLYRNIGDAVAFGAVMSHFDVLRRVIGEEGGAIVKTIGDAVMAVFRQPSDALTSALRAQALLAAPPEQGARPLQLKAGIHTGHCIAVTLNNRLDYFGSNVNIAARLEPLSQGTDIIISDAVRRDAHVAGLLEASGELKLERLETALKGFDEERFDLWRVSRKTDADTGGARDG